MKTRVFRSRSKHVVSTLNTVAFIYLCSLHLVLHLGQEHTNWRLGDGNNQWWSSYSPNHGSQPWHNVLLSNSSTKCKRSGASLWSYPLPDSERFESFPPTAVAFFSCGIVVKYSVCIRNYLCFLCWQHNNGHSK